MLKKFKLLINIARDPTKYRLGAWTLIDVVGKFNLQAIY